MKLRLPKQLCAALMAAAAVSQTALADYSINPETNICTITGTQEYVPSAMGTSSEDGTVTQFTLAENAVFIATGDQFGWGNSITQARELLMNEGSKVIVNSNSHLTGHRQIGSTTLNGNAFFEVNGNVGLNEAGLGANKLTLNNHTLSLTRSQSATQGNEFRLTQTTVSAGSINVGSGVKLYATDNSTLQSGVMLTVQKNAVAQIDGSYAISTANGPIVVDGGTLQLSTVKTTVDDDRMVADNGSGEAGDAGAFAKLFDGRAVSAINGGTLVLNGNVYTNNNSKPGDMGSDNLTITGFLNLNSQSSLQPTMWNVGSKNLTVGSGTNGGYLWLTNNQRMNVSNGGSVTIGGSLVLGHSANGSGGIHKAAFYAHKATFNAKGLELWGGMNTLALSGSDVTFERTAQNASTNLLVKKGNAANTGTVITLDGNTLHGGTNGWNLAALDGTKLIVRGDTKLDIANGKNITLGSAEISGSFSHKDGSAGTLTLTNTTFASTVTSNGANLSFGGSISVGTDISAYEVYQAGQSGPTYSAGANGFLQSTGDAQYYLLKNTADTKTTIADGVTYSNLTTTKLDNGDYVFRYNTPNLPTDVYYVNSGTVTGAQTDANTYVVASGAKLSLQGQTVAGKNVILNGGATLASSTGSGLNMRQWQSLILKGDATIDTTNGEMGIIGSNYAATDVEFNQHTLTLTGGNIFYIAKATTANGRLYLDNGIVEITKSSNMTLDSVTQNTAKTTNNRLNVGESAHVEVLGETNVRQLYVSGAAEAVFAGDVNVNNERVNISGDNTHVTIKAGLNYTGSNNYAVVLNNNSTLTFTGTTNLNGKFIGQYRNNDGSQCSTVVFASGSDVTSGDIRHSDTVANDGNIIVESGATVTSSGKVYAYTLENAGSLTVGTQLCTVNLNNATSGTITFSGTQTLKTTNLTNNGTIAAHGTAQGAGKLTLTVDYINKEKADDPTHTANLGAVVLNHAELYNNSDCESAVRNISRLTVDGASSLTQNSWNTFWNIDSLNKGTAEGNRSLTWTMSSTHFTNSVLTLSGEGDFDGLFFAKRTNNASTNGYYQAYVEIAHQNALKDAVLKADGTGTSYMTVALNADKVNLSGLQGNAMSILMAGGANRETGTEDKQQGNVIPASTGTSELVINSHDSATDEFAGKVLSGISITKDGAGTQTFSGDVSQFNGQLTATSGILKIADATPTDGNVSTIATTGLHANGGIIASEGGAIVKIINEAGGGQLTIGNNGGFSVAGTGKLIVSPWWDFNMTALREDGTATMKATGDVANYAFSREDITISDAKVTYTAANGTPTVKHTFTNSTIVAAGSGSTLTVTNSANTLVGVDAEGGAILVQNAANSAATLKTIKAVGGDVTIQSLGASATVNLTELTIAGSKTVSAYTGTPTNEQIAAAQNGSNTAVEATLAISNGTLTAGSGAKLNAHLTLGNNTTLNIADATAGGAGLTMGSTVTFEQGAKMKLSDDIINGLNGLITSQAFNTGLTLFSGVDSFFLGTNEYDSSKTYAATDFFNLDNGNGVAVTRPWDFVIKYDDVARSQSGGVVYLWMETPEPATATLSLLALAALAARRRRH